MKSHDLFKRAVILISIVAVTACASLTPAPQSLYDRLGGKAAIEAVVNDFIDAVGSDERITNEKVKASLASIDIASLKMHVTDQVCMATGGPCDYTGRDMKSTHVGLEITNDEFDYVLDDLVKTLNAYKVPEREQDELLSLRGPIRDDIVEVQGESQQ